VQTPISSGPKRMEHQCPSAYCESAPRHLQRLDPSSNSLICQNTRIPMTRGIQEGAARSFDDVFTVRYNGESKGFTSHPLTELDYVHHANGQNLANLSSEYIHGEVTEWFMVPLSKSGLCASGAWVRIPPSPPRTSRLKGTAPRLMPRSGFIPPMPLS
jgi:hypothetical protein